MSSDVRRPAELATVGGLPEPEAGCIHDLTPDDAVVLVAFGGLVANDLVGVGGGPPAAGPGAAAPPFEFFNLVGGAPVGKILVRDLDQIFYQRGVRGLGATIDEVVEGLRPLVAGRDRVVFVGQSAGGYAAILLGALLGVDEVLAFSPQTFLDRRLRRRHGDDRWPDCVAEIRGMRRAERRHLDLADVLRAGPSRTAFHLYYGSENRLDALHCRRLGAVPTVVLHPWPTGSHAVARRMREEGSLRTVLWQALGIPLPERAP